MGKKVVKITSTDISKIVEQTLKRSVSSEELQSILEQASELTSMREATPIGNGRIRYIDDTQIKSGKETSAQGFNVIKLYSANNKEIASLTHKKGAALSPMGSTKLIQGLKRLTNIKVTELDAMIAMADIKGISSNALLRTLT